MRLVTYNIHKGIGGSDRRYNLERIIEVLNEINADVICLQEVTVDLPRTKGHDQARILAEHFAPMTSFFQQNVKWKAGGYGNLVLSRWPIIEQHRISLTYLKKKPRGAQLVVIETPEGSLRLLNWHLGLGEGERHWQVARLLHHETWRASADLPTLITGDFNDWRNTLGPELLAGHGFHQASAPPSRFRSFPAILPVISIDKAFHRPDLTIEHLAVVKTKQTRQASDHLPLVVDFRLTQFESPKRTPHA